MLPLLAAGCHTGLFNSWLDPSAVGNFLDARTTEIRSSLSIQDAPSGIPGATDPTPDDLLADRREYRFTAGDALTVRIFELLAEETETQSQSQVDNAGNIRLPIIGTVHVRGMTARELEDELTDVLDQKNLIRDAQVIVEPLVRRNATYTLFGATPGANLYPLPAPEFTLMEALSIAGGLDDLITDIYIFREESETLAEIAAEPSATQPTAAETQPAETQPAAEVVEESAEEPEPSPSYLAAAHDGGGPSAGPFYSGGRQDDPPVGTDPEPPGDPGEAAAPEELELRELIESIAPAQTQPAEVEVSVKEAPGPETGAPQPAKVEPPTAQSRWVFLNGKWIETKPGASQPGGAGPGEREAFREPVPESLRL
ncbi:MAG TPA: polysaccharide biosynthesis/export family protein, partial [Phycisphaerae bacterium]|nr:polysaccharide biosynthesis/export family protein [Phycisphaerae bacterium]